MLRRRIITEVVEVTVRREVLDVEHLPLPGRPSLPHDATVAPLVIVLSEEVPDVQLRIRPYEQVTVSVDSVTRTQHLAMPVGREQAEICTETTT